MSVSKWLAGFGLLLVLCVGCDPQKAILKIFSDQGLTLLKPARSYIALGGIVVAPQHGQMQYLDPYDNMNPAGTASTSFQAIIDKQADSTANGASVSAALGSVVALPVGFKFGNGSQIQLAQINSTGSRYTTQMMASLVKQSATEGAIRPLLQAGDRVFVIQEVYTSTGISVKSSSNIGLEASYGGSGSIPTCTAPSATPSGGDQSSTTGTPSGATSSSAATAAASGGTAAHSTPSTASNSTGSAASGTTPSSSAGTSSSMSVSVGICRVSASELSFTSTNPIPFAVRLNEVYVAPGDVLAIKMTGFKLPNNALGDDAEVAGTGFVDRRNPTVNLVRIQR